MHALAERWTEARGTGKNTSFAPLVQSRERIVVIPPGIYYNLNLRTFHDALYGPPGPDDIVTFIAMRGAEFRSRSTRKPALCTGRWPRSMP